MTPQLANKLTGFTSESDIRRTVLLALSFTASADDLGKLAQQFKDMDASNTGTIQFGEFKDAMQRQSFADGALDDAALRQAFDAINQDGSGEIKYSEFVAAASAKQEFSEAQLKAAFKRWASERVRPRASAVGGFGVRAYVCCLLVGFRCPLGAVQGSYELCLAAH